MIRAVVLPGATIVAAAFALGLTSNALRDRNRIDIGRAYFAAEPASPATTNGGTDPSEPESPPPDAASRRAAAELAARAGAEFRLLDGLEVRALFEASRGLESEVLFVDARDDDHYRAAHVPGAAQIDYYNLETDIEPILPLLSVAPWIVVYCESDECDDGFLLCRELRDRHGIPPERILLFIGGMRQWQELGLPVRKGDDS
jgi:rhodanese-related sulfurtransferase